MNLEKWSFRVGTAVIAFAVLLRLASNGVLGAVVDTLSTPKAVEIIMFLETGKTVRPIEPQIPTAPTQTEPSSPTTPAPAEPTVPAQAVFAPDDANLVSVNSVCGYNADVPALIQQPLSWNLKQQAPTVLILHTHGTESYEKTEKYEESSRYRTRNTDYNVVSVGAQLAKTLEAGGIQVIHDTTMHDDPSYNASYNEARTSIKEYLKKYPSICLVLDIHRDAVTDSKGKQIRFTVDTQQGTAAQLMMVVGTDVRLKHPQWPENMSLAVKLHALLEKNYPGICRPISFRSQRFNQDLSTGAMLIEIGSAGNTRQEALLSARLLGNTILELAQGASSAQ